MRSDKSIRVYREAFFALTEITRSFRSFDGAFKFSSSARVQWLRIYT